MLTTDSTVSQSLSVLLLKGNEEDLCIGMTVKEVGAGRKNFPFAQCSGKQLRPIPNVDVWGVVCEHGINELLYWQRLFCFLTSCTVCKTGNTRAADSDDSRRKKICAHKAISKATGRNEDRARHNPAEVNQSLNLCLWNCGKSDPLLGNRKEYNRTFQGYLEKIKFH